MLRVPFWENGLGIGIADADDPRAEAVMQCSNLKCTRVSNPPVPTFYSSTCRQRRMSAGEMAGYAQTAPVLLVEPEPKSNELAIFYGYLASVNAFSALTAE